MDRTVAIRTPAGQPGSRALGEPGTRARQAAGEQLVVGDIPQPPPGFRPRAELLAKLDQVGAAAPVAHAVTGMPGTGKTQLVAGYARAKLAAGWRLVAWINAEETGGILSGLAEAAAALDLPGAGVDAVAAGRAVRHWLEADGRECLLVFDNVTDPELVQPFLPVGGAARVVITSNNQSVAHLGTGVAVDVFAEAEALAFLADRTGQDDEPGARALAEELGRLPLALAQAAAVIASQHLSHSTYLDRLRRLPVGELLPPVAAGQYPRGMAAAVLLAVEAVGAGDDRGTCDAVMSLLAVLSPTGVPRSLVHAAGQAGLPGRDGPVPGLAAEAIDRVLARLAGASLLTFSLDGSAVTVHRLVMRVIRENLAARDSLLLVCEATAQLLDDQARSLVRRWHDDRAAVRDLVEQITAVYETSATCPASDSLDRRMIRLRWWAVWFLNELGDSTTQAISIGERLAADQERILGPDHPGTLASRSNLANAYWAAGRTDEAITLHQHTLTTREHTLGPDHPDTLQSRNNLANAYQDAGRTDEAITLHQHTLTTMERTLGPDHPDTLTSRNNLANAYRVAGRTDEADALFDQAP